MHDANCPLTRIKLIQLTNNVNPSPINSADRLPPVTSPCRRRRRAARRPAKILVLFAIILPALLGVLGVVVDSGLLTAHQRQLQNIADAAATTAAMDVLQGTSQARATLTVQEYVRRHNGLADARVQLNYPPRQGRYASNPRYVELEVGARR